MKLNNKLRMLHHPLYLKRKKCKKLPRRLQEARNKLLKPNQ
jgi:hypothetical protein